MSIPRALKGDTSATKIGVGLEVTKAQIAVGVLKSVNAEQEKAVRKNRVAGDLNFIVTRRKINLVIKSHCVSDQTNRNAALFKETHAESRKIVAPHLAVPIRIVVRERPVSNAF